MNPRTSALTGQRSDLLSYTTIEATPRHPSQGGKRQEKRCRQWVVEGIEPPKPKPRIYSPLQLTNSCLTPKCRPNPRTDLSGPTLLSGLPRRTSSDAYAASALPLRGCLLRATGTASAVPVEPATTDRIGDRFQPPLDALHLPPFHIGVRVLRPVTWPSFPYYQQARDQAGRSKVLYRIGPERDARRDRTADPNALQAFPWDHQGEGSRHGRRPLQGAAPVLSVDVPVGRFPASQTPRSAWSNSLRVGTPPSHPVVLSMAYSALRRYASPG